MFAHVVHVPAVVADAPLRCCPVLQVGWSLQAYALLAPVHEPLRYLPLAQFEFEHVLHE